jgi:hypothetical protein
VASKLSTTTLIHRLMSTRLSFANRQEHAERDLVVRSMMMSTPLTSTLNRKDDSPVVRRGLATGIRFASRVLILAALALFVYSAAWNFSTRRYLRGFADAIIPLAGSQEEKTEALVAWFHHEPGRKDPATSGSSTQLIDRDPTHIVRDMHLLQIRGSASNAFMNLADASGLKVRRLLLLDQSGGTMHVVAEVQWGDRWIVVNPQQGLIFKDHLGRALTKAELHDPAVFQDAISRMPGYSPTYNFEHTIHVRLKRIPILGGPLRSVLDRFVPEWEEAINWSYLPENPALWLMVISLLLLLLGILCNLIANRYGRGRRDTITMKSHP